MRSSKSRSRNKSNRQRTLGNIVNRVFDSSGPEGKVRGTPQQIIDKYLTLARDAQLSNDRVAEQSFLQHAEHYTRMLGEAQREQAERQAQNQQGQPYPRQGGEDERENGNGRGPGGGQPYGGQYRNDAQQRADADEDEGEPRPPYQPQRGPREEPAPAQSMPQFLQAPLIEALPDAMAGGNDDAETGLVETPESQPKAKRSRAPRGEGAAARGEPKAPRGEAKAPRGNPGRGGRRKADADAPDAAPAANDGDSAVNS